MTTEASRKHTLAASVHRAIMHRQTVEHVKMCAGGTCVCVHHVRDQFTARCFETYRERAKSTGSLSASRREVGIRLGNALSVPCQRPRAGERVHFCVIRGQRERHCIRVSGKTAKEEKGSHLHGFPLPGARRIRGEHPVQPAAAAKVAGAYEYRALHNPSLA